VRLPVCAERIGVELAPWCGVFIAAAFLVVLFLTYEPGTLPRAVPTVALGAIVFAVVSAARH
jgi:hypothetical protein